MRRKLLLLLLTLSLAINAIAAPETNSKNSEGVIFFEKRIRPILAEHCYECHSASSSKLKGGLALDTEAGWMDGGDSGEVIHPGEPARSLFIEAITHEDSDLQMPPKYKLSDTEIAALSRWVKIGAPDPRDGIGSKKRPETAIDVTAGRAFWAFQQPLATPPPAVQNQPWVRDPIDHFVLAALESKGLKPVADADRRALIRRASFDLIGLPPTPEEIQAFVDDKSPQQVAFARVVDRLLASPHFGERWGRHWLDLARYAESMGRTRNWPFPFAWRYRDYVIDAFNTDKRYNRFLAEQLAGDLLAAKDDAQRDQQTVATGFLTLGSMDLNERDFKVYQADQIDEQIDVASRSIMALTISCARCHDHKFDPIPTADYYALAGIFGSTQVMNGLRNKGAGGNNYLNANAFEKLHAGGSGKIPAPAARPAVNQKRIAQLKKEIATLEQALRKDGKKRSQNAKQQRDELKQLRKQLARASSPSKKGKGGGAKLSDDLVMAVGEASKINNWRINVKGDPKNLGAEIARGVPKVLLPAGTEGLAFNQDVSGRLELARWISSEDHPLTSRVMANRIWQHLFGQGIVRTVDNFGETGERPSNRALLDHLAERFSRDNSWSIKRTIRDIMLTHTYQLGSEYERKNFLADPENRLHWRSSVRRLEAEAIRDALLVISGQLDRSPMNASPVRRMKPGEIGKNATLPEGDRFTKRSIYMPIIRNFVPPVLETFDFAEPSAVTGRRDITTVSTQALYMMNNPFVIRQAKAAADRLEDGSADPFSRVRTMYLRAFGREPSKAEATRAIAYVNAEGARGWPALYQAIFASSEFRYLQ